MPHENRRNRRNYKKLAEPRKAHPPRPDPFRTRWQIILASGAVQNFTEQQYELFLAAQTKLKEDRVPFSTWDTQQNSLSKLFRF